MRVPSYMKESIETLIRVQAEWLSEDEKSQPIGYLDEAEEKRRRRLIQDLEAVVSYEKSRLARAYRQKMAEEEDKRQLKLFKKNLMNPSAFFPNEEYKKTLLIPLSDRRVSIFEQL